MTSFSALALLGSVYHTVLLALVFCWPVRTSKQRIINRLLSVVAEYLGGAFAAFGTIGMCGLGLFFLGSCSNSNSSTADHFMLVLLFSTVSALLLAALCGKLYSSLQLSPGRVMAIKAERKGRLSACLHFAVAFLGVVGSAAGFALLVTGVISHVH